MLICYYFIHRIRWAAKRNQPVKSENTALHTAATIFVKFASSTGIIVSEELLREHFSVYGKILDTTIRTITIDEVGVSVGFRIFFDFIFLYILIISIIFISGIQPLQRLRVCELRERRRGGRSGCCLSRQLGAAKRHCEWCELPLRGWLQAPAAAAAVAAVLRH